MGLIRFPIRHLTKCAQKAALQLIHSGRVVKKPKMLCNLFALLSLLVFCSVSGQIEDFELQAAPEVKPALGNGTVSEQISFMASLRVRASDSPYGNGHVCGAVFITKRHLLTAAVCIVKIERVLKPENLIVVAGSRSRYAAPGAHVFDVEFIYIPEKYQRFPVLGMNWNVAIIRVRKFCNSF